VTINRPNQLKIHSASKNTGVCVSEKCLPKTLFSQMRPTSHALLATSAGVAIWVATSEPLAVPLTFASGVLVDGDHLPDQIWHFYLKHKPRVFVVLHAWEWLAGLVIATAVHSFPWWMVAVTVDRKSVV
jgi:hypothetical protein